MCRPDSSAGAGISRSVSLCLATVSAGERHDGPCLVDGETIKPTNDKVDCTGTESVRLVVTASIRLPECTEP